MAETQKGKSSKPEKPVTETGMHSEVATLQALGFNTMSSFGIAWTEALSEMGSEVLSFVAERIKEDVKTQHELMHCDDFTKMQEIQARFVQKAIDQYTAETGRLVAMSQRVFPTPTDADES